MVGPGLFIPIGAVGSRHELRRSVASQATCRVYWVTGRAYRRTHLTIERFLPQLRGIGVLPLPNVATFIHVKKLRSASTKEEGTSFRIVNAWNELTGQAINRTARQGSQQRAWLPKAQLEELL